MPQPVVNDLPRRVGSGADAPARPTMSCTGAVLTGGRSTRMGTDKALLTMVGRPMVTYARDALWAAGVAEVLAVGGDAGALGLLGGLRVVADHLPGRGPLGGIVTALREASHEAVVVLACDTPLVSRRVIVALLDAFIAAESAGAGRSAGAVAVAGGRRQPLIAVYTRSLLGPFAAALNGDGSVHRAIAGLELVEVRLSGDDELAAMNINSPAGVALAERRLAEARLG